LQEKEDWLPDDDPFYRKGEGGAKKLCQREYKGSGKKIVAEQLCGFETDRSRRRMTERKGKPAPYVPRRRNPKQPKKRGGPRVSDQAERKKEE